VHILERSILRSADLERHFDAFRNDQTYRLCKFSTPGIERPWPVMGRFSCRALDPCQRVFPPGFVGLGSRRTSCDPISETIAMSRISPIDLESAPLAGRLEAGAFHAVCAGQVRCDLLNRSNRWSSQHRASGP